MVRSTKTFGGSRVPPASKTAHLWNFVGDNNNTLLYLSALHKSTETDNYEKSAEQQRKNGLCYHYHRRRTWDHLAHGYFSKTTYCALAKENPCETCKAQFTKLRPKNICSLLRIQCVKFKSYIAGNVKNEIRNWSP